jgi:hypothetical protein
MTTGLSAGQVRKIYSFIKDNRSKHDVRTMCRLLQSTPNISLLERRCVPGALGANHVERASQVSVTIGSASKKTIDRGHCSRIGCESRDTGRGLPGY